jgi:uncharacterized membrane protein
MIPSTIRPFVPYIVVALGALLWLLVLRAAVRAGNLRKRPVLLAGMIAGALPALYVGLTWVGLISGSYLRLARPWLTLVCAAATIFVAMRLATGLSNQGPWRARLGDLLAQAATIIAAIAAAGPELGHPLDRLTILIAVDRSRSIDLVPSAEQRIKQELAVAELGMRDEDRIGTISFGADAATEDPPRPKSDLPAPQRVAVGRDGTDLGAAIRRALAEVPADSAARIVLLSDGVATRGDTMAAAAAAVAAEIPVDVVPLEQRTFPDIRVVALRAPTRADEGEPIELRLVTSSPSPAGIEVRLKRDGELIAQAGAKIAAGEDVLRIREKAPGPGFHRYDVEITSADPALDQSPEDNAGTAFMRVRGQAAALVLEGDAGKGAFVAKALGEAAFHVDQGSTSSVPADLSGLIGYDLVVLSDVRAPDLSPGQIDALASYVRDLGGGLVLMGGDRSMGPGGYAKTPIEEISPVSFDLKQERRRASLAEVIGIDISGSMAAHAGSHTKLELANEAAARSAALLGPGDLLGVEHVDTAVNWSVPLGPVTDKAAIEKAIRGVGPGGGGIYVDVTLAAGYAALAKEKVNLKHMLLFADGSDAERMTPCRTMVSDALRGGITTSVVALGNGSDVPELEVLSRLGNGRFYLIEDANRLPAVFAQETILASRSSIVEKEFRVARGGGASSILQGVSLDEAPPLLGYVVTIPKGRATVLLTGPEGDPILSVWSAGVGRAAAFTSDMKDRWGVRWTQWSGAARILGQVGRDVARKGEDGHVRLEADASGGELHVRATVVGDDGRAQSFRRLSVHVAGPDGFSREMALEATGAGSYAATLPLSRPGTYIAIGKDEQSGDIVGTTGAALSAGEELRPTGSDLSLLARIAELSGGKKRDTLAGIFSDRAARRFSYEDITQLLTVLAAMGLLLAVAARRLAMPEAVEAWAMRMHAERARRAAEGARHAIDTRSPDAVVNALLAAKEQRAAQQRSQAEAQAQRPPPSPAQAPLGAPPAAAPRPMQPAAAPIPRAPAPPATGPAATPPPNAGAPAAPHGQGQGRALTAAEILLARRKGQPRS